MFHNFSHSSIDGPLHCFHILAFVNNLAHLWYCQLLPALPALPYRVLIQVSVVKCPRPSGPPQPPHTFPDPPLLRY